jgi:hypothetical protein
VPFSDAWTNMPKSGSCFIAASFTTGANPSPAPAAPQAATEELPAVCRLSNLSRPGFSPRPTALRFSNHRPFTRCWIRHRNRQGRLRIQSQNQDIRAYLSRPALSELSAKDTKALAAFIPRYVTDRHSPRSFSAFRCLTAAVKLMGVSSVW